MPRTGKPELKTLFTIKTPKPGARTTPAKPGGIPPTLGWDSQQGARILDESVIKVLLYDAEMFYELQKDLPEYIIKMHVSPEAGFINFADAKEEDYVHNTTFNGVKLTIEISPFYSMLWILRDLYARLVEIADAYAESTGLEVKFDENLCWLNGQMTNMLV